jgi:predicted GIY-YIG superfamily endonuclease
MSHQPKTIQIFLPTGEPRGIRIAEITTRIVQVIEIPRSQLQHFLKMPESEKVGLYYLVGGSDSGDPTIYVGQTGELRKRLRQHNADPKKEFWERALVLISRTDSLTQTHALFLEWFSIQRMREAGRYTDENGNAGTRPYTPAPLEADCLEIFESGSILLATLGYPLFSPLVIQDPGTDTADRYFCKGSGADGTGVFTPEGFVVLKGSRGRRENVKSLEGTPAERAREKLVASDVVSIDGDTITFEKDHLFSSPSAAAITLMGRNANGWTEWKTVTGLTLDEVERKTENEA